MIQFKNFSSASRLPNYADFGLFPANYDLSWIAGNQGGGGGGLNVKQDLTSLLNGSRQDFTLSPTPTNSNLVLVVFNGQLKRQNDASGYTLSSGNLHTYFIGNAGSGDTLVCYW